MGQKITEHPQVDYWVKLTREADRRGAVLPHRESADRKELSQYADMEKARRRSSFAVILPASMTKKPDVVDTVDVEGEKGDGETDAS